MMFSGKRGVVMGFASVQSIAWRISEALLMSGAEVGFACQGEMQAERCRDVLAKEGFGGCPVWSCDVENDEEIESLFRSVGEEWGEIDFVVHALAFTDREELKNLYIETTRENFEKTLSVSAYSFTRIAYESSKVMKDGGSLLTLSYVGSNRVVHGYNVMGVAKAALEASVRYLAFDLGGRGIRVNAMSSGPMKTIAGRGVGNSRFIYRWQGRHSIMKRNMTSSDVGGSALYLLSDLSKGVTGEVHYVDGGYHMVGSVVP